MHFDTYSTGKHAGFEGLEVYLIGCCGMCGFAYMEPVANPSATTFASAIMKIQLRYGFCHTLVLDKDSKFFGVYRKALDLLQINSHILSGGNHKPMLAERVNRYINKGINIMTNERESIRVAQEAMLLLIYAWNSCPIPGTDISRSLVAVGRKFAFPIDYSAGKHWELVSSPSTVTTYSKDLAMCLTACHAVAELLIKEHRAYHRKFINANRPNSRVYAVGNIVFARRAVRSDAQQERVNKLQYTFTGPWKVTSVLPGTSYELEHCKNAGRKDKKHAADLSPYPQELIPFQQWTVLICIMASSISPSPPIRSRRQDLKDSRHVNHINSPLATLRRYSLVMISIGPASLSSMRKLRRFHGQMMVNSNVILPMTPLRPYP